jgi:hypothetical protein
VCLEIVALVSVPVYGSFTWCSVPVYGSFTWCIPALLSDRTRFSGRICFGSMVHVLSLRGLAAALLAT